MQLPKLTPSQRFAQPCPTPSADALWLAEIASRDKKNQQCTAIITADALDAQRLLQELPFFKPDLRCVLFPDWETLPYDRFSPHQDLISERLATLWRIRQNSQHDGVDVVLIPATTALYRLAPPEFIAAYTFHFKQGQQLDEAALKRQLTMAGYHHVSQVMSPGEYAARGSLIDLFPMGSNAPYRVDLFDDEIDSIRSFDPDTQRSQDTIQEVRLLPGREFPTDDDARSLFRQRWRELLEGDPTKCMLYTDMGKGFIGAGIEYYLPLFFEQTATVFDYLPEHTTLVLHHHVEDAIARFWNDVQDRYKIAKHDPQYPALAPELLFLNSEQFYLQAKPLAQLALRTPTENVKHKSHDFYSALPAIHTSSHAEQPLQLLHEHIQTSANRQLILAESAGRLTSLQDFLRASNITAAECEQLSDFIQSKTPIGITTSTLAQGFAWHEHQIDLITENELFAYSAGGTRRRRRKREQASDVDALIKDLSELTLGDPVVHSAHGIGRYRGLTHIDTGQKNPNGSNAPQEFLHLEYANEATLYVPVSQLHLISRYTGGGASEAPLHKLGSGQWDKAKRKAAQQVRDAAAELLNIYARRAARQGHAFRFSENDYTVFAQDFGFEETTDQHAAIEAVKHDMISPQPMDRLICGDVGFGKTEVALRAAFIAVAGGRQVALLAPTTLLAEQHFQTLKDRFSKWPIQIAEMSRFRSQKEITAALKGVAAGTVDIVVGTHKLLSHKTQFKNLGLLIIDEEHRFGVRHKEAMKQLRAEVDVLTLTATPIPRTLGMSLEGLRDLSIIATAPQRRLAIKTFVRSEDSGVIREAILRELKRAGQVYFLHNEVATIQNRYEQLSSIVPEARIAIAHGQMPERELERVMRDFVAQRFNVLLCSTIIETGIDVPTANTILMSRADKFGLAQLHQLRGRVGRSHHQAYAYLMVPDIRSLTKQAKKRLDAIEEMEELGSGFYLAMHDLEIRGAGEVLGENQSGNMHEIGFQLYNDMLSQAVKDLQAGKEPDLLSPLQATTEINLHAPALLPDDYCGDVQLRLSFYKKLATAKHNDHIDNIVHELVDRFGKLPEPTTTLIAVHRLRVLSQRYGIHKVEAAPTVVTIIFKPNPPIEPASIIALIQKNKHIKLAGNEKLRIERALEQPEQRAKLVSDILRGLQLVG